MWPYNPVTKAKFVSRNLQKLGFREAMAQIENTPEIIALEGVGVLEAVAKEGGGDGEEVPEAVTVEMDEKEEEDPDGVAKEGGRDGEEVPEAVTVEREEKEVKGPDIVAEEGGGDGDKVPEAGTVEREEMKVEDPEVEAHSRTKEHAQTQILRKRNGPEVEVNVTPSSSKRVRFSDHVTEFPQVIAEEGEIKRGEKSRQGIRLLLSLGEKEDHGSSSVKTVQEQEDSLFESPLRPTLPSPLRTTNAAILSGQPVMGSLLPAPADPLLCSGQSLGNLSPASLPSPGYTPRSSS